MTEAKRIDELRGLIPQCLLPDQVRLGSRLVALLRDREGRHRRGPLLERWLVQARRSVAARVSRAAVAPLVRYPAGLPIVAHREELIAAIQRHPVIIVAGETGSGKTTQLPKFCLEAGLGVRARIGCTQPRRVAALSIARRLAEELEVTPGREVGAKIRFSDDTRAETAIKVMTDGILLAEVQGDPFLSEYEAVILDEAHERSLNLDFLMGHLKHLVAKRDDLKLIITSATIDTERFSAAFAGAPVFQVSGRMFPVEVRYRPIDEAAEESGETTYVDAAVETVRELLAGSRQGDILVFMPSERDIQETCARLEPRPDDPWEIVPLFGRLSGGEQQRVFDPRESRRVVVATNIAETSLTVPRIRYVVDTGLARISRYQSGTRCRRLPIEPISQSSANQRKGRCGRVSDGVCIRLYAEEDFQERPLFTPPEIERCNLAEVVLRLKAWPMGEVEDFPFIDPPPAAALRGAYQLLKELGALDESLRLAALGRDLARMPVDPSIGRMLIEAHREHALSEVLIIAAGLSIQDPRELPLEERDAAKAAHRKFEDRRSDFLALLNIWNAYHDTWESLSTQSQMRKFCRTHFLSYLRMREWRDVQAQLADVLADMGGFELNREPADYAAIHRSILTGLWGHIGQRTGRNEYRMAGGRAVGLFPGSGLFDATARRPKGSTAPNPDEPKGAQPDWIVAGETVETSRSFARTVAAINPEWVIELAPHLCRSEYLNPGWDRASGRVQAKERVTLAGLVLRERTVPYSKVDAAAATRMFIESALVAGDFEARWSFLEHNHRLRQKIEIWQTRLPHRLVADLDEAFAGFYASRLEGVSSLTELNRWLREHGGAGALHAGAAEILGEHAARFESGEFPDSVRIGDQVVPVAYAYAPGEDQDGVTLRLNVPLASVVDAEKLEWAVPSLRMERVAQLLRLLPKTLRRSLMPLPSTARAIIEAIPPDSDAFLVGMTLFIRQRYGIEIPRAAWSVEALPAHLRPRFEIMGTESGAPLVGRDLANLVRRLPRADPTQSELWHQAASKWERYDLTGWDLGNVPEHYVVGEVAGLPVFAYPGLQWDQEAVNLRLFPDRATAGRATRDGWSRLAERVIHRELAWIQKDLRALQDVKVLYVTLGSGDELMATAWENLRRYLLPPRAGAALVASEFEAYLERARQRLPGLAQTLVERVRPILQRRQEALMHRRPFPGMKQELDALLPSRFLEQIPFERLAHVPRYLQALVVRAERAALNPAKDAERARQIEPFWRAWADGMAAASGKPDALEAWAAFRWLVEEFKVSSFAQELGTAVPVSPKRLATARDEVRRVVSGLNASGIKG